MSLLVAVEAPPVPAVAVMVISLEVSPAVVVETPPEIAVAILAEMTAVRHGVKIPETIEPAKHNVSAGCAVPSAGR